MLTGAYPHNIDTKGRLFIPARLRDALGDVFYVAMGTDTYLTIYPQKSWDEVLAKFNALPSSAVGHMRYFIATAERCVPDSQGRILLPAKLRNYANLEREVVIAGQSLRAEIWAAEAWNRQEEEAMNPEKMRACMAALGF